MSHYCFRRGAGNAVDDRATAAERDQVMGHSNSGIFQAYLNERVKCDVQAAFLGRPSRDAAIRLMGHMSRSRDPRAPKSISEVDAESLMAIQTDHELIKLKNERDELTRDIRHQYGTLKRAEAEGLDVELIKRHKQVQATLHRLKNRRKSLALENSRQKYFATIDTIEIDKQFEEVDMQIDKELIDPSLLAAESSSTRALQAPVTYRFQERSRVANVASSATFELPEQECLDLRIRFIKDLAALCHKREPRQIEKFRLLDTSTETSSSLKPEPELFPIVCISTQCLFCMGNEHFDLPVRTRSFARPDAAKRHLTNQHLKYYGENEVIRCPHPQCVAELEGVMHFKNHAASIHNVAC